MYARPQRLRALGPDRRTLRLWAPFGLLFLLAVPVDGQSRGAYLPIADPATAITDHLVARGVLAGLPAVERPFSIGALRAAVSAADTVALGTGDRARLRWLAEYLGISPESGRWEGSFQPGVGAQAGTQPRRQLLLPEGDGGLWYPVVRVRTGAEFGPFSIQFDAQQEPRLRRDPDRPTQDLPSSGSSAYPLIPVGRSGLGAFRSDVSRALRIGALRLPAALVRGEWKWASVEWGQLERNWGPPGVPGLLISPLGYHRPGFGFTMGPRALEFQWHTAPLSPALPDSTGATAARWFTLHRLRWTPSTDFELALWETSVNAEAGGPDPARFSPVSVFNFGKQFGNGDARNATLGLDLAWRPTRGLLLETQFLLDDLILENADENPYPNRFGFTLQARGALDSGASFRGYLTGLSSLAVTASTPEEAYLDDGVGLGRLRPDHLEAGASVSFPWGFAGGGSPEILSNFGLAEVGLRWRRQGIRRFTDPYPILQQGPGADQFPTWSRDIEREVWALVNKVDAELGPFTVQWEAHLQHRRFPASGADSEWGAEALVQVIWRVGTWHFGGEG